jgi:rubrerythrin
MTTRDETLAPAGTTRPIGAAGWDCPACGVTASVHDDVCDVCCAELDEFRLDPWGESPQVTYPAQPAQ